MLPPQDGTPASNPGSEDMDHKDTEDDNDEDDLAVKQQQQQHHAHALARIQAVSTRPTTMAAKEFFANGGTREWESLPKRLERLVGVLNDWVSTGTRRSKLLLERVVCASVLLVNVVGVASLKDGIACDGCGDAVLKTTVLSWFSK